MTVFIAGARKLQPWLGLKPTWLGSAPRCETNPGRRVLTKYSPCYRNLAGTRVADSFVGRSARVLESVASVSQIPWVLHCVECRGACVDASASFQMQNLSQPFPRPATKGDV